MKKTTGLNIQEPKERKKTEDKNDPFTGTISLRGRTFVGDVVSDKMTKTVSVEWQRKIFVPKYERYEKRKSRVKAHNPESINAKTGDKVKIVESRPISKTKKFVVVEILDK